MIRDITQNIQPLIKLIDLFSMKNQQYVKYIITARVNKVLRCCESLNTLFDLHR